MGSLSKYVIEVWSLSKLVELLQEDKRRLNLNPDYQRNAIWTVPVQRALITTIVSGMPLPCFFIRKLSSNRYEMVDGQQRCRAINSYYNNWLSDSDKKFYLDLTNEKKTEFMRYSICVVVLSDQLSDDEVRDYYVLVNSSGAKLNKAELRKAQYHDTKLLTLCNRLADNPLFRKLKLFTVNSSNRMNDIDFVSELITILLFGITDKKLVMEDAYNEDINEMQAASLEKEFLRILELISCIDDRVNIGNTRLRQKADFYTLFGFLHKVPDFPADNLQALFEVLITLDDEISPSQDKCDNLREYALACVSQSNSKKAREHRLEFFENMFLNKGEKPTTDQVLVVSYLGGKYKKVNDYLVVDLTI